MIDWQALGLAAARTFCFMVAYFSGLVVLAVVTRYGQRTDEWTRAGAMWFSGIMFVAWILVIAGVVG